MLNETQASPRAAGEPPPAAAPQVAPPLVGAVPVGGARGLLARRWASGPLPSLQISEHSPVFPPSQVDSPQNAGVSRHGPIGREARRELRPGVGAGHTDPLDQAVADLLGPVSGAPGPGAAHRPTTAVAGASGRAVQVPPLDLGRVAGSGLDEATRELLEGAGVAASAPIGGHYAEILGRDRPRTAARADTGNGPLPTDRPASPPRGPVAR
jgi:hypothetical protein